DVIFYESNSFQKRDSSSSDDGEADRGLQKVVRFVRPGESSQIRRKKKSRSGGFNDFHRDLSMSDESLCSGDRPPHLLNLMDLWIEKHAEDSGVFTSTEVLIYNLPLHANDGLIYALCDKVVSVLSVQVHRSYFNNMPFATAAVQLRSPDEARLLKKFLHLKPLRGKVLHVIFSSDFY
ncbi:hypothetical protein GE061_010931, partial [Apolygus lucorum]